MDHDRFDVLTRSVAGAGETRRSMFKLLAAAAVGSLAARIGLSQGADAKPKRKHKPKRRPAARRTGQLQAEGKRKGKKRGKKKPPPQPPACGDGKKPCPGGSCVSQALCCPGQRMCADGKCQPQRQCCPDEYECPGGACIDPLEECCPGQRKCDGNLCIPQDECCPDEVPCADGSCIPLGGNECCPGEQPCGDGTCVAEDECCEFLVPLCQEGQEAICCHGEWVCRYHRDRPAICATLPERTYNPANCRCECPPNSNDSLGRCCPWEYPNGSPLDGYCCKDTGRFEDCVCAIGFSRVNGLCRRTN